MLGRAGLGAGLRAAAVPGPASLLRRARAAGTQRSPPAPSTPQLHRAAGTPSRGSPGGLGARVLATGPLLPRTPLAAAPGHWRSCSVFLRSAASGRLRAGLGRDAGDAKGSRGVKQLPLFYEEINVSLKMP